MDNKTYTDQPELPLKISNEISLKTTPMFQQYLLIKSEYEDCLLFFRMGDFYELFFDDAVKAAGELDIALTSRGQYDREPVPMCGVPYHSYMPYLQKLTKKGYKVAICEQTENPDEAKKRGGYKAIVKREVIRVVTPGTLVEDLLLQPKKNNFLISLQSRNKQYGIAWIDISVGDLYTQSCSENDLFTIISSIRPSEALISQELLSENNNIESFLIKNLNCLITPYNKNLQNNKKVKKQINEYFHIESIDVFGKFNNQELSSCWALLEYIGLTQKDNVPPVRFPKSLQTSSNMKIDPFTRKSLEVNITLKGERKGSLIDTIDKTLTAAGSRQLDKDLSSPLTKIEDINYRLNMLELLYENSEINNFIRNVLKNGSDIDRAKARIISGRGSPKDLLALKIGIRNAKEIKKNIVNSQNKKFLKYFSKIIKTLEGSKKLLEILDQSISEKLSNNLNDGGFILEGYSSKLDNIRGLKNESRKILIDLEAKEKSNTQIPTLKIKYNNIIGHFFEVTQLQKEKLLQSKNNEKFIPRQSLKGVARFTTEELSRLSESINNANQQSLELELKLFEELKDKVYENRESLSEISESLARIDVLSSHASLANEKNYTRPLMVKESVLEIKGGRHPVVENAVSGSLDIGFCSNDCLLDNKEKIWLLTGPNMAGKSTFLRQNAIIAILAQSGSFIPADYAKIGIVDMLFSRVGAADDLGSGRSTFMVEMLETATILNQATENSFVIMDEVGRGTSTYDGLSLAWAILEHIHDINNCRTLFATHYHELTKLQDLLTTLSCHTMKVKEWNKKVIFLYTVIKGFANESYGIHVADLAGIPKSVLHRAKHILDNFEKDNKNVYKSNKVKKNIKNADIKKFLSIIKKIESLDPNNLSPKNALDLIYEYKDQIHKLDKKQLD